MHIMYLLISILFKYLLELSYIQYINPHFEYINFLLYVNHLKYIESWAIFLILYKFIPRKFERPSCFTMAFLYFAYLTPLLVFYGLSDASREFLYIVLGAVVIIYITKQGKLIKFPVVDGGFIIVVGIIVSCIILTTSWMLISGGIKFFNLDFERVYDFRIDSSETINIGVMTYINSWTPNVFAPLLIAISLLKKKYFLLPIIISLQIFWFGINSAKGVVFYPLLVIFLWWYYRGPKPKSLIYIPTYMSLLILVSLIAFFMFDSGYIGSLFVRRVLFVPSVLTFTYFDFFSQNNLVYWSNSFTTSWFIEYPYEQSVPKVINKYLGLRGGHANNSFLSTGYMHAGIFGMALYGSFFGYLLRFIDSISSTGTSRWLAMVCIIVPMQGLILSSDLLTSLLTHGLGIGILMIYLIRQKSHIN